MIAWLQRYALAGTAAALLLVSVWAGWTKLQLEQERTAHQATQAGFAIERAEAAETAQRQAAKADAAATAYESRLAAAKRSRKVIVKESERVITAAPDLYARTCLDAGGLSAVAAAVAGTATDDSGSPTPALP